MKKVGIVTFTTGFNYGNRLQNYAVQEIVKDFGFCAETICDNEIRFYTVKRNIKHIISILYGCLKATNITKLTEFERKTAFDRFNNKYINLSKLNLFDERRLEKSLDAFEFFITGSDQVWNPFFIDSDNYLLAFAPDGKKIAFSASIGVNVLPEEVRDKYKRLIDKIDFVSVREERAADIIEELGLNKPKVLSDPTLALEKEKWLKLVEKSSVRVQEKYILCYFLGRMPENRKIEFQQLADDLSCEIINPLDDRNRKIYSYDPVDFLKLIKESELVITDSFHATVFSILFHKPFYVFNRKCLESMESRIDTLLTTFGFQSRRVYEDEHIKNEEIGNIDFKKSDLKIESERKRVYDFLSDALGKK